MTGPKPYERTTYAGKMLTEKRRQMGLSQQRLSSMTGLSLRVYQRLETGEMDFHDTRMKFGLALCMILGLDPYLMVFGHEFTYGAILNIDDFGQNQSRDSELLSDC